MSDSDLIEFTNGRDQPIPFDTKDVETAVLSIVSKSVEDGSPEVAFQAGRQFIKAGRLSIFALSKLAYEMSRVWAKYNVASRFEESALQEWGISNDTLQRYIRIHRMHDNPEYQIPPTALEAINQRPLSDQVAIANAVSAGYPISDEQWERLANAADGNEVRAIVREVKDEPARSTMLSLTMDEKGNLFAYDSDGVRHDVGYLYIGTDWPEHEDESVRRSINRILNGAGISVR